MCSLFELALSADVFELALFAHVFELLSKLSGRVVLVLVVLSVVVVSESVVVVSVVFSVYGFFCDFIFGSCRWR